MQNAGDLCFLSQQLALLVAIVLQSLATRQTVECRHLGLRVGFRQPRSALQMATHTSRPVSRMRCVRFYPWLVQLECSDPVSVKMVGFAHLIR